MAGNEKLLKNKYFLALMQFQKFGSRRINKIKSVFPDFKSAFNSSAFELLKTGIEEKVIDEFISFRKNIDPDAIVDRLIREKIEVVFLDDADYPKLLKEASDPPPLLYYKGTLDNSGLCLAVVGSRKNTAYGKQVTEYLVNDLSRNGITIVSGLALGTDSLAHHTALKNNGRTIAVIGSGIDHRSIYPKENIYLADKITEAKGAVFSEFPPGTPPLKQHFPQRNRIIAGMSLGILVIEAAKRSGALITARFGLEYNREIFAVPGNIFSPSSTGTNDIIGQGAHLATSAIGIMDELGISFNEYSKNCNKTAIKSPEEEKILAHLSHEPSHINDIIRKAGLDTSRIISTLTIMEIKGMVKNVGNMEYVKL